MSQHVSWHDYCGISSTHMCACDIHIVKSLYGKSPDVLEIQFVTFVLELAMKLPHKLCSLKQVIFILVPSHWQLFVYEKLAVFVYIPDISKSDLC